MSRSSASSLAALLLAILLASIFVSSDAEDVFRPRSHSPSPSVSTSDLVPSSLPLLPHRPLPVLSLSNASAPRVLYLGMFPNPSSASPGAELVLSWQCFFCESLDDTATVTIVTNNSVTVVSEAPVNGSTLYRVPPELPATALIVFTAQLSDSTAPMYSLPMQLHYAQPSLTLYSPVGNTYVYQSAGLMLDWLCMECYLPPTVSFYWQGTGTESGVIASGVPVPDVGITVPIPDDMVLASDVTVTVSYDGDPAISAFAQVTVKP